MENISVIDGTLRPSRDPKSVAAVTAVERRGPWVSKSGGDLHLLLALPMQGIENFLSYDAEEIARLPEDIRGLRMYSVTKVPSGSEGGGHYHRLRKEIFYPISGVFEVRCEDVWGSKASFLLDRNRGLYVPEFMFHSYRCLDEGGFAVLCNTLFNPTEPRTHDNFESREFARLKKSFQKQ